MSTKAILDGLNDGQYRAVTAPLNGQLEILAGPGTGKTKTLTSRVAHILATEDVKPHQMVVMTFTKAAAAEMANRVTGMTDMDLKTLKIGTFHSMMWRYLRFQGKEHGYIGEDPSIMDQEDAESLVAEVIRDAHVQSVLKRINGKTVAGTRTNGKKYLRVISKLKNDNLQLKSYLATNDQEEDVVTVWKEYESRKSLMGSVDFDDILLLGRDLIRDHPEVISNIKCLLVDEFQDSNGVQMEIVKCFANVCPSITVVGDPDQSIYGFRGAVPENMRIMHRWFKNIETIYLEQNYRSTQPILNHAMKLIQQDTERLGGDRKLIGNSKLQFKKPVVLSVEDNFDETLKVANQVEHLISSNVIYPNEIAILTRLRRPMMMFQKQLNKKSIPSHIVNGHDFWDRAEIKTIICYLRVISSSNDAIALERVLQNPNIGVGTATLDRIKSARKESDSKSYLDQLEHYARHDPSALKLTAPTATNIIKLIDFIHICRQKLQANTLESVKQVTSDIAMTFKIVDHHTTVKPNNAKFTELNRKSRNDNVRDLLDIIGGDKSALADDMHSYEANPDEDEQALNNELVQEPTLQQFLYNNVLNADMSAKSKASAVTISTIHASKGLEWPVVFVVGCNHGFNMGDDDDSVRRLLYVSMTRAKVLSFLSWPAHNEWDEKQKQNDFLAKSVSGVADSQTDTFQELTPEELKAVAEFMGRKYVDQVAAPPATNGFVSAGSLLSASSMKENTPPNGYRKQAVEKRRKGEAVKSRKSRKSY